MERMIDVMKHRDILGSVIKDMLLSDRVAAKTDASGAFAVETAKRIVKWPSPPIPTTPTRLFGLGA